MISRFLTTLSRHRLPLLALLLALACVAVAAVKLAMPRPGDDERVLAAQNCDPAADSCTAGLPDGGRLTLSIAPNPVRPLVPLQVRVGLEATQADRIEVLFTGVQMDMGVQRSPLTGDGRQFDGQAMLPVCTTGAMTWAATVRLTRHSGTLVLPFHFNVPAK